MRLLLALGLALLPLVVAGQAELPECSPSGPRDGCRGEVSLPNGDRYVGGYAGGRFSGQGTYTWANGETYVGAYRDGQPHGQGAYSFANGDTYVGEFRDGQRSGEGVYLSSNGTEYIGAFLRGQPHGKGSMTFPSGNKYTGAFENGQFHGTGTMTFATGDRYEGGFQRGEFSGRGRLLFADGAMFTGEFLDGARQGEGVEYRADGTSVRSGKWSQGRLVQPYALDRGRFPFGAVALAAVTGPGETPGGQDQPGAHDLPVRITSAAPPSPQQLKACVDGMKFDGPRKIATHHLRELARQWCVIAAGYPELLDTIELTDKFQASIDSSLVDFSRGQLGYARLSIGNPLIQATLSGRYDGALGFILAHELGHHVFGHAASRRFSEAATVVVNVAFGLGGAIAARSWKGKALSVAAALVMYCSAFTKYKNEEITADRSGIDRLKALGQDAAGAAGAFLRLMRHTNTDNVKPSCLSAAQIAEKRSVLISTRNPHPYIDDREAEIIQWLSR